MALLSSVSIIGLGLIGSSLARAIKENGIASTIFGYDCNPAHSAFCLTHRIIDQACATEEEIARASSFLVLCTPPAAASAMMHTIGKKLPPGCVVTDTASVKQFMADNIIPHISGAARYVPAHPIAGNEKSGPEGGSASLFMRRKTILCPQESELSDSETTLVKRFWERVGSSVELMPPDIHDKIYGCISHLPQLLSFAMVPVMKTAGSGAWTAPVQRFTRLCHSPTGLWAELFVLNSAALLESLKQYETLLRQIVVDFRHGARQGQPSTQKGDATLLYFHASPHRAWP